MSGRKQYQPSRRKLSKARASGYVAKSHELTICFSLLAVCILLRFGENPLLSFQRLMLKTAGAARDFHTNNMLVSVQDACAVWLSLVCPILLTVLLSTLLAELAQVGFAFSWESITMKLSRLNFGTGVKRLLGIQNGSESCFPSGLIYQLIKNLLILGIAAAVGWGEGIRLLIPLLSADLESAEESASAAGSFLWELSLAVICGFAFLGVADLLIARKRRTDRLRMDAEEFKQELRESEGDPEVRAMRRQLYQDLLQHGILEGIRQAKVVVMGTGKANFRPKSL